MEVKVKLLRVEKIKLTSKFDEESNMLKTQVSFEVEGKLESLVRVMSLAQQRQPIYAVIGCEQATFDLAVARVPEKDKTTKASKPSDKPGDAGQPGGVGKPGEGNGNGHGSDEQSQGIVGQEKDTAKDTAKEKAPTA